MLSRLVKTTLLIALLTLAACAPEDLDITPSATPSPEPTAAPTSEPGSTPTEEVTAEAVISQERVLLDQIVSIVPGSINAAPIVWQRTNDPITYRDEEGGVTARIPFSERGGGASELTFGVFDTPEAALAFYEAVRGRLRTLERSEQRDNFPQPNAFGGGTYGSDAIWVRDNIFVRVSVPRFSSTAGDPLVPFGRQVIGILEEALAS